MSVKRDDYRITPDEELLEIYKRNKRLKWLMSLPMVPTIYLTWLEIVTFVFEMIKPEKVDMALTYFLCSCSMLTALGGFTLVLNEHGRLHLRITYILCFVQAGLLVPNLLFCHSEIAMIVTLVLLLFLSCFVNLMAHPIILNLEALREHPHYPFNNWRTYDNYLSGRTGDTAVKLIENTMNKGKVVSTSHEDVFEGKAKAFEPPKPDPEKNLQQRTQIWRDESDKTAYTLDNMHRMYFDDGKEYGELSGKDLEKQLMKATAPSKPPEQLPEDFFQQQTIVWRNKNDGVGSRPPERPEGDKERTVLP